jgi:hypothetical protein
MKIEVSKEEQVFKPITLKIVVETEQELCDMYIRMNAAPAAVNHGSSGLKYKANHISGGLFGVLDNLFNNEYKYLRE